LDDALNYLIKELNSIIKKEETSLELNDSLSNKIVVFSLITLGVMLFLGLIETFYIQRYLERKKLI
jgi:hypothetical protein